MLCFSLFTLSIFREDKEMKCRLCNQEAIPCITHWTNTNCERLIIYCVDHEFLFHYLNKNYNLDTSIQELEEIIK